MIAEDSATGQPLRPRLVLEPSPDGLSAVLVSRAEALVNNEWASLTECVLHAHLLLEQALTERLKRKMRQPDAFDNRTFARLGFAQMITVYAGLYAPDPEDLQRLLSFNRLRNRIAHTLDDPEALILDALRAVTPESRRHDASPVDLLQVHFLCLLFFALLGIQSVHQHDPDGQWSQYSQPVLNDNGDHVCSTCGKR